MPAAESHCVPLWAGLAKGLAKGLWPKAWPEPWPNQKVSFDSSSLLSSPSSSEVSRGGSTGTLRAIKSHEAMMHGVVLGNYLGSLDAGNPTTPC